MPSSDGVVHQQPRLEVPRVPIEKLSSDQIAALGSAYVSFLRGLSVGEGARAGTKQEGVTKVTLKKRLAKAAEIAGVKIKFHRSPPDAVILERVG
jgi:hypothetical protein